MKKQGIVTSLKLLAGAAILAAWGHSAFADCPTNGLRAVVAPNYTDFNTSSAASGTFTAVQRDQQVYQALQFPSGPIVIRELR